MSFGLKKGISSLALVSVLGVSGAVQAQLFDVTAVLQGNDGGYGFSSFHDANDSTPMSGPKLANITGVSGTYDDASGAFNVFLNISDLNSTVGSPTLAAISGTLLFDGSGFLDPGTTVSVMFNGTNGFLSNTEIGFRAGDVCCSGTGDPNSLLNGVQDGGGFPVMSLWGANWDYGAQDPLFNPGGTVEQSYTGSTLGMDLRLRLEPVPVPAAVWLFGSGLVGLVGVARRKSV